MNRTRSILTALLLALLPAVPAVLHAADAPGRTTHRLTRVIRFASYRWYVPMSSPSANTWPSMAFRSVFLSRLGLTFSSVSSAYSRKW